VANDFFFICFKNFKIFFEKKILFDHVPNISTKIESFFQKPLFIIVHSEESKARGCLLTAVQLSPYHHGRKLQVFDAILHGFGMKWCKEGDE
jgi:hypothetical protein